jgi:hypothetical protein
MKLVEIGELDQRLPPDLSIPRADYPSVYLPFLAVGGQILLAGGRMYHFGLLLRVKLEDGRSTYIGMSLVRFHFE